MNRPLSSILLAGVFGCGALSAALDAAHAGPNANGYLNVVYQSDVDYTTDQDSYCGSGIAPCHDGISSYTDTNTIVLSVIASFSAAPRLVGTVFGLDYDPSEITIVAYGPCGDFELPTNSWPNPGEGTAITWQTAQTDPVVDIYWMAAYDYYGLPSTLDLVPHPTQGAFFADDSVPSILDPIAGLGRFGFFTNGDVYCPEPPSPGACCFSDGSCTIELPGLCDAVGGEFQGEGTDCDTVICDSEPDGACCLADGLVCQVISEVLCGLAGGEYLGDDTTCDPFPCATPVIETGWGQIKSTYR